MKRMICLLLLVSSAHADVSEKERQRAKAEFECRKESFVPEGHQTVIRQGGSKIADGYAAGSMRRQQQERMQLQKDLYRSCMLSRGYRE